MHENLLKYNQRIFKHLYILYSNIRKPYRFRDILIEASVFTVPSKKNFGTKLREFLTIFVLLTDFCTFRTVKLVYSLYILNEPHVQSLANVSIENLCENSYNIYIENLRLICYSVMGFSRK